MTICVIHNDCKPDTIHLEEDLKDPLRKAFKVQTIRVAIQQNQEQKDKTTDLSNRMGAKWPTCERLSHWRFWYLC